MGGKLAHPAFGPVFYFVPDASLPQAFSAIRLIMRSFQSGSMDTLNHTAGEADDM